MDTSTSTSTCTRVDAEMEVSFYEAQYANEGDLSTPLDRITVQGFRAACKEAREWMTTDEPRKCTVNKHQAQDFLQGSIPDVILRGYREDGTHDIVAVVEVYSEDVTE